MVSWINLLEVTKPETIDLVPIEKRFQSLPNSVKNTTNSYIFDSESATLIRPSRSKMSELERKEKKAEFDKLIPKRFQKKANVALIIPAGGDLGKSGPGARAKAAAAKNARKTGGGSTFAQGFTPQRQYGSRPINKPLSYQNYGKLKNNPFDNNHGKNDYKGRSSSSPTCLEMEKPASMPQQKYSSMTKSERRQLPDRRDRSINVDGYPRLDLRFNQVKYKTPKHGKDHDLPVDKTGKTPKTEANAIALRDSLVDMPNRKNITWYPDGKYQGGTARGCNSVNLFDVNSKVIAVYQKQPDGSYSFLTTCTLTPAEAEHLEKSDGNFLTEKMINQQSALSTNIHDSTNTKNDL